MIKKLIRNLFHDAESMASEAEQNAKDYTDALQTTGTFTITCPRLNNQSIPFQYVKLFDNLIIASAIFQANSSSDTGQLYLLIEGFDVFGDSSDFDVFGTCTFGSNSKVVARRNVNRNAWIEGLTGANASGSMATISLIFHKLVGGVTKLLTYLSSLLNRKAVMA